MEPSATSNARGPLLGTLGTGAVFVGGLAYVGLSDPHRAGFLFPGCPFKLLTGWNCPACGGLRMTHDLLHGDIGAAVVDNVFLTIGLPLLAIWLLLRWRRGLRLMPIPATVTIGVLALAWTVVRNWPGFPLVPTLIGG
ncbi:DUF2752 domain-containing protein [Mycobacterium sp. AZCC_0083]|jgi:hypothetical protein|uniref:DUF2752 domain-containing protein n=1 Tax=Mycobacterium sp. AZCC_0083 TaxID=2735882 RepID=UPI001607F738|nr:DUF2752 domain-containing protein [Mycobacterium sp. AZCC_0083]MBB5160173.1 hypothetical protein [Mycobacterium sp. AZCC_0083]